MKLMRATTALRVLVALMLSLAIVAMHQLGSANHAHAAEMSMSHESPSDHVMHHDLAMSDHPIKGDSRGMEHPTNCTTDEHSCQGVATQDFALPFQPELSTAVMATPCLTCSKYAAARHEHDPPGRAELSVWRI